MFYVLKITHEDTRQLILLFSLLTLNIKGLLNQHLNPSGNPFLAILGPLITPENQKGT